MFEVHIKGTQDIGVTLSFHVGGHYCQIFSIEAINYQNQSNYYEAIRDFFYRRPFVLSSIVKVENLKLETMYPHKSNHILGSPSTKKKKATNNRKKGVVMETEIHSYTQRIYNFTFEEFL